MEESSPLRVRAAGICVVAGQVLMESLADRELWGVPGGRVEVGETLEQACVREYREELGMHVSCERLAMVGDCFFELDDGSVSHDLTFYFIVEPPGRPYKPPVVDSHEPELKFTWLPIEALNAVDLVPEHLLTLLPRAIRSERTLYASYDARKDGKDMCATTVVRR
ncbi:NUDIX hydrolase [Stackebrandtia soli]|uniref:NUDIX hydrolase n=1 Tax=Stackebrandtia soli TaxID=1892856 RepID=UPI0039EC6B0D